MVNLLSKRMLGWMGVLAFASPATPEEAVESDKQQDGQKPAEVVPPVAASISVVAVRAEVGPTKAVGVPKRPEDEAEDKRDCDEDENGWNEDEGKHRISRFVRL
jgi:hypothetical protein